jgi:hypothetical protein
MAAETIMILLALLLIASGAALSRWMKGFALVPATILAWIAAVNLAGLYSFSLIQTVGTAFLCGACLQLGYLVGAFLWSHRIAPAKKHAALAARR